MIQRPNGSLQHTPPTIITIRAATVDPPSSWRGMFLLALGFILLMNGFPRPWVMIGGASVILSTCSSAGSAKSSPNPRAAPTGVGGQILPYGMIWFIAWK